VGYRLGRDAVRNNVEVMMERQTPLARGIVYDAVLPKGKRESRRKTALGIALRDWKQIGG
jgi:hypothetical protein